MGTSIEGAVVAAPQASAAAIAHDLRELFQSIDANEAVLHVFAGRLGSHNVLWAEFSDGRRNSLGVERQLAQFLTQRYATRGLWYKFSDSTGEEAFASFDQGTLCASAEANDASERGSILAKAFDAMFPDSNISDPEDIFDAAYGDAVVASSFQLVKGGTLLQRPEVWIAPPEEPYRRSLLDREFSWGRPFRVMVRVLAFLFGGGVVLLIIAALIAYVVEMWQ